MKNKVTKKKALFLLCDSEVQVYRQPKNKIEIMINKLFWIIANQTYKKNVPICIEYGMFFCDDGNII